MTKIVGSTLQAYPSREVRLGALTIARALPVRQRRMVGAWCFVDRFGPISFGAERPLDVAPHPHIGLQTVTWLLEGEVRHDDTLGSEATVYPGGVNVMTAGRGIAHAERTPLRHSGTLSGIQLWAALPDAQRQVAPTFESIAEVPKLEPAGGIVQVFAGDLMGTTSPAAVYSETVGADLRVIAGATLGLDVRPDFEHALLVLDGDCSFEGQPLRKKALYTLGPGRSAIALSSETSARVLLLGGPPFPEEILMWWNFVARTREELAEARADWAAHRRFGEVTAYDGPRLEAPSLGKLAPANPVS